jgi:pyruvate dehydrogenase E1 component beta subunit
MTLMKFTEAILDATSIALSKYENSFVIGLGVSYKNGADGTMGDLKEVYPLRVLDTPVSEATTTGVTLGTAITGMRPIIHHGRVEFALFAADQIITQAAKWNYMFGGDYCAPVVFRIAVGRQWGNGPQHTQALYSLFGNTMGLKVVIPSTPYMAKALLLAAIEDNNPVVFLEPRWLYQTKCEVPEGYFVESLSESRVLREGRDVTVVTYGDGVIATMKAAEILMTQGVNIEVIDLVSINPIDYSNILKSVNKTGNLVTVDTTNYSFNVGSEIISKVTSKSFTSLQSAPIIISTPDVPCPTAPSLTAAYYPTEISIANEILGSMKLNLVSEKLSFEQLHLPPTDILNYA